MYQQTKLAEILLLSARFWCNRIVPISDCSFSTFYMKFVQGGLRLLWESLLTCILRVSINSIGVASFIALWRKEWCHLMDGKSSLKWYWTIFLIILFLSFMQNVSSSVYWRSYIYWSIDFYDYFIFSLLWE